MTLSERIAALRTGLGMSQGDVAEKLEVSRQSVSKWETGQSVPDLDKIIKLADLFGVTVDALVREGERPQPPQPAQGQEPKPSQAPEPQPAQPPEAQVVYLKEKGGLTATQKAGVCVEVVGLALALLGLVGAGALLVLIGAGLIILGLPLLLARKHPWLICGWLVVGLSLAVLNPYTSVTPWGLISGLQWLVIFALHPTLRNPAYLIGLPIAIGRGLLTLVLLWQTWRAWRKRKEQRNEERR